MKEIKIKFIPHSKQRYDTCGDYIYTKNGIIITVSDTKNRDYNFLVALHEIIESYLCQKRGIKEPKITKFDLNFKGKGEPGNSKEAPYHLEHLFATKLEKLMAKELKVNWPKYSDKIDSL